MIVPTGSTPHAHALARVRIDEWGVPHISADSAAGVFYAQGYVVACDRLFQLDLWRRRGLGLMSEAFGADFLEHDSAARQFLFRGDMEQEWSAYGRDSESVVRRFVAGINARIDEVLSGEAQRPVEFDHFGYDPLHWLPEDVVRIRRHGLFDNARSEVVRAQTLLSFGEEIEDLRRVREPKHPLRVEDEATLRKLFPGALRNYDLAKDSPGIAGVPAAQASIDGSNSWVIGGSKTESGRPILANDPHRAMTLPSLRYLVHLECPEFNVIGGGEPMLPGVSLGHNDHVAFGLTIFPTDQEDVYVYDLDDDGRYLYEGEWEAMATVEELIPVRDAEPRPVELRFTRHGPVTGIRDDKAVACAVRAAWLEPGMAPYLGSLRYLGAKNVEEFEAAVRWWGAPTVNQVYADVSGRIGWHACGKVHAREWDGLLPVAGDGSREWSGLLPFEALPGVVSRADGWIATANERPATGSDAGGAATGYEWLAPYRYEVISSELEAASELSLADSVRLQFDTFSIPAREVVSILRQSLRSIPEPRDPSYARVLQELCTWDCRAGADSVGAGVFETWFRGPLLEMAMEAKTASLRPGDEAAVRAILEPDYPDALPHDPRPLLVTLDELHRADPHSLRDLLVSSLRETQAQLSAAAGEDPGNWALGRLQSAWFRHAAHPQSPDGWTIPPIPIGGTPDTVNVTARDANGHQTIGASLRLVMDVGDWDASRAINSPGQSGDPRSRHYSDLIGLWATGGTFPLCFSDAAIAQHLEREYSIELPGDTGLTDDIGSDREREETGRT